VRPRRLKGTFATNSCCVNAVVVGSLKPHRVREGRDMRRRPINGRRIVLVGRDACWALAILIIVVAFALASPRAGAAATPPDANLLRTYQPVLIFHANDLFRSP